jgi:hypothetical protein
MSVAGMLPHPLAPAGRSTIGGLNSYIQFKNPETNLSKSRDKAITHAAFCQ